MSGQLARHLRSRLPGSARRFLHGSQDREGPPAFVFDIDGVLVKGKQILEPAKKALGLLYENKDRPLYPTVFMTNGGGVTEAEKAEHLSEWLNISVHSDQVVLSHTPYRKLVKHLGDKPVLISGRGNFHHVAREYGFTQCVSTTQLARALPDALPLSQQEPDDHEEGPCPVHDLGLGSEEKPFKAALLFNDPGDWYRDLQLFTDIALSGGVIGRERAPEGSKPVEVSFSHKDLLYATSFPTARFGMGAFAIALETLYQKVSGQPLPCKYYGKPMPDQYRMVEAVLVQQAQHMGLELPQQSGIGTEALPFSTIYMIGDNPASDIRGARNAGLPWASILVKTGVFCGPGDNSEADPADIVVDHVADAVEAALHRYRHTRWHSMR
ncbi:hypothetical protein WJX74_007420 [Apatococcus lobatus]|uniref:Uncharacterized protein n=1 Tax=Apatococcus lobatus TaxID=904363 RepID=A0AAW1RCA2_9CHLO